MNDKAAWIAAKLGADDQSVFHQSIVLPADRESVVREVLNELELLLAVKR